MTQRHAGEATARIPAPPDRVFAAIGAVVGAPGELAEGVEWFVRGERAHVIEYDRAARRLAYRSKPERENPSFAIWTWEVEPDGGDTASRVRLGWEVRAATIFDKRVVAPLRLRTIERTDAPASLVALGEAC